MEQILKDLFKHQAVVTEDDLIWELLINSYSEKAMDTFFKNLKDNRNFEKVLYDVEEVDEFGNGFVRSRFLEDVELSPNDYQEYAYIRILKWIID